MSLPLYGTDSYNEQLGTIGVAFDTRDHEVVPIRGTFDDLSLRCSPGDLGGPAFCGYNLTLRAYVSLYGRRLHIASRLVGDVLTRRATLLALPAFGGFEGAGAMAGSQGIRGVPTGRFAARTKLLGSAELRSYFLPFKVFRQALTLGAAAFIDAGRVWTGALRAEPALDGSGLGLRWGAGAGLRLRWGEAMVIRADLAHSPWGADLGRAISTHIEVGTPY